MNTLNHRPNTRPRECSIPGSSSRDTQLPRRNQPKAEHATCIARLSPVVKPSHTKSSLLSSPHVATGFILGPESPIRAHRHQSVAIHAPKRYAQPQSGVFESLVNLSELEIPFLAAVFLAGQARRSAHGNFRQRFAAFQALISLVLMSSAGMRRFIRNSECERLTR